MPLVVATRRKPHPNLLSFSRVNSREEETTKERERLERESREDNQRETALQIYIDKMSELLLNKRLGCELTSNGKLEPAEEEVRKIARVRTLTVLPRLDAKRKRSVLQFLHESGLINKSNPVIDLKGANLTYVNLWRADLVEANLNYADLWRADVVEANLCDTNLMGADLREANLKGATGITNEELKRQAKSLKGATMPDGSIHP